MPDDSNENGWVPQSRRQWMKYMAATGAAAGLAGCSGDGGGNGGGNGNGGAKTTTQLGGKMTNTNVGTETGTDKGTPTPQESFDGYYRLPAVFNLAKADFNIWNPSSNMFYPNRLIWEGFAEYSVGKATWMPTGATDWKYDKNTVTIDLRDDMRWHTGTDGKKGQKVTAEHVANHFWLGKVRAWPPWSITESVNVTGKHQLEFKLKTGAKSFQLPQVLGTNWTHWFWTHPKLHRKFIERAKDATTKSERNKVNGDLAEYSIPPKEAIKKGIGFGPFKPTSYANTTMTLEPHEDYPWGLGRGKPENYKPNYKGIQFEDFGESESDFHEAAIADKIDGFTGTTSRTVRKQMGDHWVFRPNPSFGPQSIIFSPKSKWGKDNEKSRALRQAIGYLYDPAQWQAIRGENVSRLPKPNKVTGLNTPQDNQFLSDVLGDFTNYGNTKTSPKWSLKGKAKKKMQEAGYTKDGKWWKDSDGNVLSVNVIYNNSWTANIPAYKNAIEQLRSFGIKANGQGKANNPLLNTMGQHDFEIALMSHGFGPHAYDSYANSLGTVKSNLPQGSVYTNEKKKLTVPWPVGNPNGDLKTVNVNEKINALGTATEQSKVNRLVNELGWIWNQWVPSVEMHTPVRLQYLATDTWEWNVAQTSPQFNMEQPWVYCSRSGQLNGIPQN